MRPKPDKSGGGVSDPVCSDTVTMVSGGGGAINFTVAAAG